MLEVNGKSLIVNGSINPALNKSEFLSFVDDREYFLQGCWNMVVEMTSSYSKPINLNWDDAPKYQELKAGLIDIAKESAIEFGSKVFERFELFKQQHKTYKFDQDLMKGQALGEVMRDTFKPQQGRITLNSAQLLGFAKETMSSFNNFNNANFRSAVLKIYELEITNNYGDNNPNTGKECLYWEVDLMNMDTVWCVFGDHLGITSNTLEEINEKEGLIRGIFKATMPDCVKRTDHFWPKINGEGYTDRIHQVRLKLFWD